MTTNARVCVYIQTTCTFAWDTTPNVQFDIKGPFPTTFSDPVAIWCGCVSHDIMIYIIHIYVYVYRCLKIGHPYV